METSTSPTSRTTAWPSSGPPASGCATGAPRVRTTDSSPGPTASPLTRPITYTWPTRTTSASRSSQERAGTWPSGASQASSRSSAGLRWEAAAVPRSTAPTCGATTSPASITAAPSCSGAATTENNRITQFHTDGTPTGKVFGHLGSDSSSLHWPFGIASVGSDLVVADTFNNRVERIDGTGLTVQWSTNALHNPRDVTVAGGVGYVADSNGNSVVKLDASTGNVITSFGGLHNPQGIAVAPSGNIWVE